MCETKEIIINNFKKKYTNDEDLGKEFRKRFKFKKVIIDNIIIDINHDIPNDYDLGKIIRKSNNIIIYHDVV